MTKMRLSRSISSLTPCWKACPTVTPSVLASTGVPPHGDSQPVDAVGDTSHVRYGRRVREADCLRHGLPRLGEAAGVLVLPQHVLGLERVTEPLDGVLGRAPFFDLAFGAVPGLVTGRVPVIAVREGLYESRPVASKR